MTLWKPQCPPPNSECNPMVDRDDISTPEAAYYHNCKRAIVAEIPALDSSADILLLLGWDILRVHKVHQQCNETHNAPFDLTEGELLLAMCSHTPKTITTFKNMLPR